MADSSCNRSRKALPTNVSMSDDDMEWFRRICDHPGLTREQEHELAVRAKDGDTSACCKLLRCNCRLVFTQASSFFNKYNMCPFAVFTEGIVGMAESLEKFDPSLGNRLSTFLVPRILKCIQMYMYENAKALNIPQGFWDLRQKMRRIEFDPHRGWADEGEIAERLGISTKRVQRVRTFFLPPVSFDALLVSSKITANDDEPRTFAEVYDPNPDRQQYGFGTEDRLNACLDIKRLRSAMAWLYEKDPRAATVVDLHILQEMEYEEVATKGNLTGARTGELLSRKELIPLKHKGIKLLREYFGLRAETETPETDTIPETRVEQPAPAGRKHSPAGSGRTKKPAHGNSRPGTLAVMNRLTESGQDEVRAAMDWLRRQDYSAARIVDLNIRQGVKMSDMPKRSGLKSERSGKYITVPYAYGLRRNGIALLEKYFGLVTNDQKNEAAA